MLSSKIWHIHINLCIQMLCSDCKLWTGIRIISTIKSDQRRTAAVDSMKYLILVNECDENWSQMKRECVSTVETGVMTGDECKLYQNDWWQRHRDWQNAVIGSSMKSSIFWLFNLLLVLCCVTRPDHDHEMISILIAGNVVTMCSISSGHTGPRSPASATWDTW